ncbi:hypothetical protein G6F50_018253 [Rhizopus delemar]|uniref:Uncharacterized protein n=1 Tax=Rhizopus delemar TaxID=936053 RepID=A0A9P6XN10_9FUNG|nr:hypothetical protein G6F50_018253 [Rhizopus delemar]
MRARPAKTATQRLISISVAQSDSTMAGSITGPPAACSWSCFAPTSMPAAGLSPSPRSTAGTTASMPSITPTRACSSPTPRS